MKHKSSKNKIGKSISRQAGRKNLHVSKISVKVHALKMRKKAVRKAAKLATRNNKARLSSRKPRMVRRRIKVSVVRHVRVMTRPVIKKEIMMPEAWSRVEKYKKVKKDAWGYGNYY